MNTKDIFNNYCNKQTGHLEARMFVKAFRQANLLGDRLTTSDLDIIFIKNRAQGKRTIKYEEFCKALKEASTYLPLSYDDMVAILAKSGKPIYIGTSTLPVRFHDDISRYTGIHAHGGPSFK